MDLQNDVIRDILEDFLETMHYCDPISLEFCKTEIYLCGDFRVFSVYSRLFCDFEEAVIFSGFSF